MGAPAWMVGWRQNLAGCGRCTGIAATFITGCFMGWSIATQSASGSVREQMLASTFSPIAGGCTISKASHTEYSKHCGCNSNTYNCYDRHTYTLVVVSSGSAHPSDSIDLERSNGKCESDNLSPLASPLASASGTDTVIPCWEPDDPSSVVRQDMSIPTANVLLEGYRCGSYECVKLADPASEVPAAPEGSGLYIAAFAVAFIYFVAACYLGERVDKRIREESAGS